MMKGLKLFLMFTIVFSTVTPVLAAEQKKPGRVRAFLRRNKKKIAAGVTLAAAVGLTAIGLYYHAQKTKRAIRDAGITPSDDGYEDAILAVGLLGPLGMNRTLSILSKALERNVVTPKFATYLVFSPIGAALANYFGVKPSVFRAQATHRGIKGLARGVLREAREEFKREFAAFKSWVTKK